MDHFVIAKTSDQMIEAQHSLVEFMTNKVRTEEEDLAEKESNLKHAKEAKIRTKGWSQEVSKAKERVRYYKTALAALEAGYAIVPEFPISIIAVKTSRRRPVEQDMPARRVFKDVEAESLPVGEGEYVGPEPMFLRYLNTNGEKEVPMLRTVDFRPVDFPLKLVKPQILEEFDKATRAKIFDAIGIIPAGNSRKRSSDPMLIGQIYCKEGTKSRTLNFLITWWIDTKTL